MISDQALATAVETGVITTDQAMRLRALEVGRATSGAEPEDDEKLRFVSGFGDIFVTIGIGLFLSASAYFLSALSGPIGMAAGLAAASWGLAEFFTRRRRMALPSIVLLIVFAAASYLVALRLFQIGLGGSNISFSNGIPAEGALSHAGAGLMTVLLAAAHYWRFRVPITIAAGTAAAGVTALAVISYIAPQFTAQWVTLLVFAIGLAIFALAMHFDLSDRSRLTRHTDIAFWLHLLAAPLIVHPLVEGMIGGQRAFDTRSAVAMLGLFLALGCIAVLIDRRALLVSGLSYAGVAFASLLRETGLTDSTVPSTMLALGLFVLLLSAGWRPLRALLLGALPDAIARKLPYNAVSANP